MEKANWKARFLMTHRSTIRSTDRPTVHSTVRPTVRSTILVGCCCFVLVTVSAVTVWGQVAGQVAGQRTAAGVPGVEEAFQLAAGHYEREEWSEATQAFESVIQQHAGSEQADVAHFFLGEARMQRQQYREAYLAWQNYLARLPNHDFSGRATFRMGEAAMRMEMLPQSIRLLESFVDQHPNDPLMQFALAYLGEMRLTRGELQLSQRVFETGLRVQPAGSIANRCRFGLARSLQLQGSTQEALHFYEFIIREPENPLADQAAVEAGIISFAENQIEQSIAFLQPVADSPLPAATRSKANYWLGRINVGRENFAAAIDHFRQIDPADVEPDVAVAAWYDGAIAATRAGDHDQASQWLSRLVQEHPNHSLADDAMFLLARNAADQGDLQEASRLASELLTSHADGPFGIEASEIVGRHAYQQQQYDDAIQRFSKLIQSSAENRSITPTKRASWSYLLALSHLGLEQFQQAESILSRLPASGLSGDDVDELGDESLTSESLPSESLASESLASESGGNIDSLPTLVQAALATARFSQNKYLLAIPNYENYLAIAGRNSETRPQQLELTLAYAHAKRWDDAEQAFAAWVDQKPQPNQIGEAATQLASISKEHGTPQQTEVWYLAMTRPGNAEGTIAAGLANLAWLKFEQGDNAAAQPLFERLLNEFPSHPETAKAGLARGKSLEATGDLALAAKAYASVAEHSADAQNSSLAKLRQAYVLQRIGSADALKRASAILNRWLADASNDPNQLRLLPEAIYQAGWICHDLGQLDERDQRFEELVKRFPDSKYWPDAAYRIADRRVESRNYKDATTLIAAIIKNDQSPARIRDRSRYLKGQIETKQQKWAAAERTFASLVESTTDARLRSKSRYWRAESLYRQGKFSIATEKFAQLQRDAGGELATLGPWIALRLAQSQGKLEQWKNAAATAQQALDQFQNFTLAYEYDFFIARGFEDDGRLNDAVARYRTVIDSPRGGSTETAAMAQWRIGEIRFHQEDYAAAINAYYRVDSIFGYPRWRSASLLQAGKCQEHLQNFKHAEKLYRQLLQLFPESELAAETQSRLRQLQAVAAKPSDPSDKRLNTKR